MTGTPQVADAERGRTRAIAARALAKVRVRLLPFMFVLYVVSYLDRVNVGFAALSMNRDLGFSAGTYGFGAGIFFLSYFLFEVPSNLIMQRVGARLWIARIMITWGVISAAMLMVHGTGSFYMLRFLLGAAEAGFFPGMILYLTQWFPAEERARAVAQFMTATAIAGVIGSPLSGALMQMHGALGLRGWQWLFLLEGVPAVVLGIAVLRWLPNGPADAAWLAPEERAAIVARLEGEQHAIGAHAHVRLADAFRSGRVWLLALLYFTVIVAFYGVAFWVPQILQAFGGLGSLAIGFMSALPYIAAAVGMVAVGAHSDRTGERRWHIAVPAIVGAVGLVASGAAPTPVAALAALSIAALGVWSALGPFWTWPAQFLRGPAAAGGIAIINSVGNIGGFVGPSIIGLVRDRTGSFTAGLDVLAAGLLGAAGLALCLPRYARTPH